MDGSREKEGREGRKKERKKERKRTTYQTDGKSIALVSCVCNVCICGRVCLFVYRTEGIDARRRGVSMRYAI